MTGACPQVNRDRAQSASVTVSKGRCGSTTSRTVSRSARLTGTGTAGSPPATVRELHSSPPVLVPSALGRDTTGRRCGTAGRGGRATARGAGRPVLLRYVRPVVLVRQLGRARTFRARLAVIA